MKKVIIILSVCFLITVSASTVSAQFDFPGLKQIILTGIDRALNRIDIIESKIENNPRISDLTKQSVIEALNMVEETLVLYKDDVEKAETLKELRAANQAIIKYLWENKDVIRENIRKAIVDIANEAVEKAEEFKEKVRQALKILKVVCPAEKETIAQVEAQLDQLEEEIDILKQAIKSKDILTIRREVKEIRELIEDIRDNLEKIQESCFGED